MGVRLLISICHPLLLVRCNNCMGVDYATLTQALLQVLASSSMQYCFPTSRFKSHSHALNSHPMADLIPMGTPRDPLDPSLPHSHHPMHISRTDTSLNQTTKSSYLAKMYCYVSLLLPFLWASVFCPGKFCSSWYSAVSMDSPWHYTNQSTCPMLFLSRFQEMQL